MCLRCFLPLPGQWRPAPGAQGAPMAIYAERPAAGHRPVGRGAADLQDVQEARRLAVGTGPVDG